MQMQQTHTVSGNTTWEAASMISTLQKVEGRGASSDPLASLGTERLRLRCVQSEDAAQVSRLMTPAISRWVASWPVPFTPEMAAERIAAAREAAEMGRLLPFAIERRFDGVLLGWISVTRDAKDDRRGELGYWLGEEHHGRGYMREAAAVVVAAAFDRLGLEVIEAGAQPGNVDAFAVLRGCGMASTGGRTVFAPARGHDELYLFYETARPNG
jgi:ribosomal-protein-alanine N-acetyltransferase